MQTKLQIVTQLPLRGLWNDSGPVNATRRQDLSSNDVRELLLNAEVQFVVADVGLKPRWIDLKDCYRFWMDEVQHHLVEPETKVTPNQEPNVYWYRASGWYSEEFGDRPVVVLEVCH